MPLIDDHVRAVGREVRELARLHGELASVEIKHGSRRLILAVAFIAFGVMMGTLVIVAFCLALFAWIRTVLATPAAAAIVGLACAGIMGGAWYMSWRLIRSSRTLLLPQTRQMLGEMFQCHDRPTNSSEKSAPGAGG